MYNRNREKLWFHYKIDADVELTFVVRNQIMATIQRQIAVFTTPDAVICKNGSTITHCSGNTNQQ